MRGDSGKEIARKSVAIVSLCLLYTSCLYYGSEVEFQKGVSIDLGPNAPLSTLGRAYFGDYLEDVYKRQDLYLKKRA